MSRAKTREELVEEIRRLQFSREEPDAAVPLPTETPTPTATPAPSEGPQPARSLDERSTLRELLSELTTRLDRSQEQVLSRLGDLTPAAEPPPAPAAGTAQERAVFEEILARLGPADATESREWEERLARLETRLDQVLEFVSAQNGRGSTTVLAPLFARFTALEKRWEEAFAARAERTDETPAPSRGLDLTPVIAALTTLVERLVAIQERTPGAPPRAARARP